MCVCVDDEKGALMDGAALPSASSVLLIQCIQLPVY